MGPRVYPWGSIIVLNLFYNMEILKNQYKITLIIILCLPAPLSSQKKSECDKHAKNTDRPELTHADAVISNEIDCQPQHWGYDHR